MAVPGVSERFEQVFQLSSFGGCGRWVVWVAGCHWLIRYDLENRLAFHPPDYSRFLRPIDVVPFGSDTSRPSVLTLMGPV